jgi:hypothetical protein
LIELLRLDVVASLDDGELVLAAGSLDDRTRPGRPDLEVVREHGFLLAVEQVEGVPPESATVKALLAGDHVAAVRVPGEPRQTPLGLCEIEDGSARDALDREPSSGREGQPLSVRRERAERVSVSHGPELPDARHVLKART